MARDPDRPPGWYCNGKQDTCNNRAGKGTPHVGQGCCRMHGGNTPAHVEKAERELVTQRMRTYGVPIDTDPMNALMDEVKRSAGIVALLEHRLENLPENVEGAPGETLIELGKFGTQPSVWLKLFNEERAHLARVCKMALDAGVSQNLLDLLKQQSKAWIDVFAAVGNDPELGLSEEMRRLYLRVVDKHLERLLQEGERIN